ncbi:MAG: ATP-binding protein [Actinomycetota bacterium]
MQAHSEGRPTPAGDTEQGGRRRLAPRRLVLVLALMTLGPLAVLDVAALWLSEHATRSQGTRQVQSAAAAAAVAVQREMTGLTELVESFARRPSLTAAVGRGVSTDADRAQVRFHLGELRSVRPEIHLAFLADPSGRLVDVLPESPSVVGDDFSHRDWYRGVMSGGRPYVSEVYETAAADGGLVTATAVPIRGGDATTVLGILVAGYRIGQLQRFVDGFAAVQGVALTVTDQRGVVVASPGADPRAKVSRRSDPGVAAALGGRFGASEAARTEGRVLSAHVPITGLGWALVADLPLRVATEMVAGLRAAILAITAGLALVIVAGLAILDRALRRQAVAEEELRRSRSFLDSVIENIPNMVFVKDAEELRFVRFNRAGEELLGYSRDDLVGRNDFDFFPPEEARFFVEKDREVLERGRLLDIPCEPVQTRHQGERILHTRKIPIMGPDGSARYLLGISEDITERQRAEAALEEARLTAQRANEAKSQFLSRMSHELRTPLNAVLGFGQLLALDDLSAGQRESVDQIVRAGGHLLELIDEVLDISRVEAGQLRLSMEPVSLEEVVAEALGMVRPLAAARRVRIPERLTGAGGRHVQADRQRLRQVVVNLLANAVKYNRHDGEVAVVCESPEPGQLRLLVSDTGIGMTQQDLDRLFQPFERLGAEQSGVEGTGLGLVLTKQLVEVMGGVIGVSSEVGSGTSFWVDLPVIDAPGERTADRRDDAGAERPAPAGAARSVLYVEDNLSNVKLVERVVARRPEVDLLVAMHGTLALELAREHQPSLILLDLHLPDMSGEEVLRRLRADARTAAIPVVVLSADATVGQVERIRAGGASDYLTKPFDIPHLLGIIDGTGRPAPAAPADGDARGDGPLDAAMVEALHELARDSGSGRSGLRDAVSTFVDEGASRLAGLRAAMADRDAAGMARLAHSLAGSSATFGAVLLARECRALEALAKDGDLGPAPTVVRRVEGAFEDAVVALREQFLDGDGEPAR